MVLAVRGCIKSAARFEHAPDFGKGDGPIRFDVIKHVIGNHGVKRMRGERKPAHIAHSEPEGETHRRKLASCVFNHAQRKIRERNAPVGGNPLVVLQPQGAGATANLQDLAIQMALKVTKNPLMPILRGKSLIQLQAVVENICIAILLAQPMFTCIS
jgi:hypothetical protein